MKQELKSLYIEIAKGITKNYETDIKYIAQQIETYRNHEHGGDIIRNLGILYYDLLPEGSKQDLIKVIQMDEENVHLLLFIAQYLVSQKELDKAHDILIIMLTEIETWEASTTSKQFFSFDNLIEFFMYVQSYPSEKEIIRSKYPFHEMYRTMAAIEYSKKQFEQSLNTLQTALLHNPMDADLMLDIAEIHQAKGDQEQFFFYSKEALLCAYDAELLARCYRNIGSYFMQETKFDEAIASYYMSLIFEKHDLALKALYRIYEITKQELDTPDLDVIKEVLECNSIQTGASTLVVDTLLQLAKEYDEMSEREQAIHYLEMAYQLTNDESLLPVIEEMKTTKEIE